jgi:hypothetical protein
MKYLKYIHIVFALLFVFSAIVQWNDPDSMIWMAIYSTAALAAVVAFLEKISKKVLLGLMIATFLGICLISPEVYASLVHYDPNLKPDPTITHTANHQTESFKEIGGLGIILIALFFQYYTIPTTK